MATLKELMGDLKRGDGRKFKKRVWSDTFYFEPIFKEIDNLWFGLNQYGMAEDYFEDDYKDWLPCTESNAKKKIKLYRGIYKNAGIRQIYQFGEWQIDKNVIDYYLKNLVGWQEMEVEVDE